jgi:hypothetical protein
MMIIQPNLNFLRKDSGAMKSLTSMKLAFFILACFALITTQATEIYIH